MDDAFNSNGDIVNVVRGILALFALRDDAS